MTRFLYTGPMQSLDLRVPDLTAGEGATALLPVTCIPGQPVDLPEGHPVTIALDDAGFLAPAPDEAVATPAIEAEAVFDASARARGRAAIETPKE